jgi:hypothetical protein
MLVASSYRYLLTDLYQIDLRSTLILLYVVVTYAFAMRTYEEARTSKEGARVWGAVGLLLCIVWPVLIAMVGFEALRRKDHW